MEADELLPYVARSQLLADAVLLHPIIPVDEQPLIPIDYAGGTHTHDLTPSGGSVQTPVGKTLAELVLVRGTLGYVVRDSSNNPISEKHYTIEEDGIHFEDGYEPAPGTIQAYYKAAVPCQEWALDHHDLYDGDNDSFNRVLINKDDAGWEVCTTVSNGRLTTIASHSEILASYAYWYSRTKYYCGANNNWIDDHLRLRPDVFVGKKDYPGDATVAGGEPGLVPEFVERGTYTLDSRRGLVTFIAGVIDPTDYTIDEIGNVDNDPTKPSVVRALYAYLNGISNVTGQVLTVIAGTDGKHYKADTEAVFPDSHGKKWVYQRSPNTVVNVRVDGAEVPTIQSVALETLTVKTSG